MKTLKKVVITVIVLGVLIGGTAYGLKYYKQHRVDSMEVEGNLVQSLNAAEWVNYGDTSYGTGIVSSENRQVIYYSVDKPVKEIKVAEGDHVEIGDALLTYDTAKTDLQKEIQQIELQKLENEIILAQRELEHLKTVTPVADEDPNAVDLPNDTDDKDGHTTNKPVTIKDMFDGPMMSGDAYNYIKNGAVPYAGDGSVDSPYQFLCTQSCFVYGKYLNTLVEKGLIANFNVFEGNDIERNQMVFTWKFDGTVESQVDKDEIFSVETKQPVERAYTEEEEENISNEELEDNDVENPVEEGDKQESYTAKELQEAIKDKEEDLEKLDFSKRKKELEFQKLEKSIGSADALAVVAGTVTRVGDPEAMGEYDSNILVEVSSAKGKFITGSISELQLDSIRVGDKIYATSWGTNEKYEATVTEVSDYPVDDGNFYNYGSNSNVSYYPFTAFVEDGDMLEAGEALDLSLGDETKKAAEIVIEKSYIRKEAGRSYVYICGAEDKLEKRYVDTGKTYDGYYVEILAGLKESDFIVFPYGSNVREGVRVTHEDYYFEDDSEEGYNDEFVDTYDNDDVIEEITDDEEE